MKRKLINSLRLLLVAAWLCMGANVWAGDYSPVYQRTYEAGTNQWSAADVTAWGSDANLAVLDATGFVNWFGFKDASATGSASYNLTIADDAKVKYEAEWYVQSTYGGSGAYGYSILRLGGIAIKVWDNQQNNDIAFSLDGGTTYGDAFQTKKSAKFVRNGATLSVVVIENSANNTVESLSITMDGVTYTTSNLPSTTFTAGVNTVGLSAVKGNYTSRSLLKSLTISQMEQDVTAVDYTVKFQDTSGNTLKTDVVYSKGAIVGELYTASASDMETFYNDGSTKKYVYKSGQNTETTASETASENVITLVFDTYDKYNYTIKQKLGDNDATTLASGSKYGDETLLYYYPKCVKSGDNYYVINANGSEPLYGVTVSSSNKTPTLTYTLDEDIIYYAECETLYGGTYSAKYFEEKSSNGASKAMYGDVFMKTSMGLAADGVFDVTISGGNRDTGHTTTANLKLINSSDQISEDNVISQYMSGGAWIGEMNASNVTIPAGSELYIVTDNTSGVSRYVFDYIIVRKSAVTYTVKYKCGGVEIKDADASRTAVWGTYASLTDADKVDVTYNGHLYRYESDDASSQQIVSGGTTVITATFRDLGAVTTITYALNVGTDAGTTIKSSATSTDASNIIGVDIDQTKAAGDGKGASDRTTKLPIKTGDNGETYDSPTNYVVFKYTVAAGKKFTLNYATIKVANVGSTSANKVKYKAELSDGTNTLSNTYVVTTQDGTVETFYVSNNSEVAFTGNVTLKLWAWTIDDTSNASAFRMGTPLEITGTLESLPEVSATINSTTGYATFSCTSPVNVDVEGLEAYIATAQNDGYITMQKVTGDVAANTGLVLKGNVGDYNLPIVASGTTYNTESDPKNYLFAISSNYNLGTPVNGTNYVLSVQSGKVVFAPIGATAAPVTAGHAALWIPAVGARMLEMSFADDETTGISQIENRRLDAENSVYNLNGQRVTKPSKGLYIIGGKKVILK